MSARLNRCSAIYPSLQISGEDNDIDAFSGDEAIHVSLFFVVDMFIAATILTALCVGTLVVQMRSLPTFIGRLTIAILVGLRRVVAIVVIGAGIIIDTYIVFIVMSLMESAVVTICSRR